MKLSITVVAAFILLAPLGVAAQSTESTPEFKPRKLMKPLRAIVNAPMLPAARVKDQVFEGELVLGIVVNGQARAYPINMLTGPRREIINDTVGRVPLAATW